MNEAESEVPLIPEPFFVSGRPVKSIRPKLARPKQLSQYVFPHFGMIMFDLFWVKYTLFLRLKCDYDLDKQRHLFFWAEKNGHINPRHGVLYYSLLSRYKSTLHLSPDISVGSLWASGRLFKKGWREKIVAKLVEYSRNPNSFDFKKFVDYVFSSDFKSDCNRKGVDLANTMGVGMYREDEGDSAKVDTGDITNTIGWFVDTLAYLLKSHEEICREGSVIEPNIDFTQKVLLEKLEDPERLRDLKKLANTNFVFDQQESEIFLKLLQATEKGRCFARSLFLLFYLDPLSHKTGYLKRQLRNVSKIFRKTRDIEKRIQSQFGNLISHSTLEGLGETCFYWELNFFLADIENAARELLEKYPFRVSVYEVDRYFSRVHDPVEAFIEKLHENKLWDFLEKLIPRLKEDNERITATLLSQLVDASHTTRKSSKLLLEFMAEFGTLEKETEKLYSVLAPLPEDWSYAFFYGIDPLIDWARTMLKGLRYGK